MIFYEIQDNDIFVSGKGTRPLEKPGQNPPLGIVESKTFNALVAPISGGHYRTVLCCRFPSLLSFMDESLPGRLAQVKGVLMGDFESPLAPGEPDSYGRGRYPEPPFERVREPEGNGV